MKINKDEFIRSTIIGGLFGFTVVVLLAIFLPAHKSVIELPEEIKIAKKGDLLQIEGINNDTIKIGFYHGKRKV